MTEETLAFPIRYIRFVPVPDTNEAAVMVVETTKGQKHSFVLSPKQMNRLAEELVTVADQLQPQTKQ